MRTAPTTFGHKVRLFIATLFDSKTPTRAKIIMWVGILYGVSPFDLIPDFIPLLGLTDDAVILIIAFMLFLRWTESVRKEQERKVIDV